MKRTWIMVAAVGLAVSFAGAKGKVKPSVNYAKTWEAAVAEAKLLNVPIVVHSHGFY
jgi:hypothetical protein